MKNVIEKVFGITYCSMKPEKDSLGSFYLPICLLSRQSTTDVVTVAYLGIVAENRGKIRLIKNPIVDTLREIFF